MSDPPGLFRSGATACRWTVDFGQSRLMLRHMVCRVHNFRPIVAALGVAACLAAVPAQAQDGDLAPPVTDTGGIDGDLAGLPPRAPEIRYAPGVLEAYQEKVRVYEQQVATEAAAQKLRDETFRRQNATYEQEMAAYRAARRKYEADRAAYDAAMARRR